RLRRAVGPVTAPEYAREIQRGDLTLKTTNNQTTVSAHTDDTHELAPFVRYTYWAEIQMPPERRVKIDAAVEIPPADGVTPAAPADGAHPAEPAQIQDLPGLFSPASPPTSIIAAPPGPPAILAGASAAIKQEAGQLHATLDAPATPSTDPLAIGPYRLRLWEQW